ncbi:MAG TPA: hypothetical protein VFQ68_42585 [Streptosporangiaceae bacterium]|nr:hypothetical protein [Streptosporangiaceae bacterium]
MDEQRGCLLPASYLNPSIRVGPQLAEVIRVKKKASRRAARHRAIELLADLRDDAGLALVMVSHDLAVVAQLGDEVLVLRQGKVLEQGPTAEVLYRPRHEYTQMLIAEHEQYGLDKFLDQDQEAVDSAR